MASPEARRVKRGGAFPARRPERDVHTVYSDSDGDVDRRWSLRDASAGPIAATAPRFGSARPGQDDRQGEGMTRVSRWVRLCLAGVCLLLAAAASAQETLELDAQQSRGRARTGAAPCARRRRGGRHRDGIDLARAGPLRSRCPTARPRSASSDGALWFHARVVNRNPGEPRWLLVQTFALSGPHRPLRPLRRRSRHPPRQRRFAALRTAQCSLPSSELLKSTCRRASRWTCSCASSSQNSMQVPLTLYSPLAFAEMLRDAQLAIGLYYGILLALFFYNLALWLILRDASYFWYLFHLSAFGLVLFTLNGLGFRVPVAALALAGGKIGAAVDLPVADRRTAVHARVPRTEEALAAGRAHHARADRLFRTAGDRLRPGCRTG